MKLKKILQISALSLAVVSCASVITSADVIDSTQKSYFASLYKTLKGEKANEVINKDAEFIKKVEAKLDGHQVVDSKKDLILNAFDNGATIEKFVQKGLILANTGDNGQKAFERYRDKIVQGIEKVQSYNETLTGEDRAKMEVELSKVINKDFGTMSFAKNSDGVTTMMVEDKNGNTIGEINFDEIEEIKQEIEGLKDYNALKKYAEGLGIK